MKCSRLFVSIVSHIKSGFDKYLWSKALREIERNFQFYLNEFIKFLVSDTAFFNFTTTNYVYPCGFYITHKKLKFMGNWKRYLARIYLCNSGKFSLFVYIFWVLAANLSTFVSRRYHSISKASKPFNINPPKRGSVWQYISGDSAYLPVNRWVSLPFEVADSFNQIRHTALIWSRDCHRRVNHLQIWREFPFLLSLQTIIFVTPYVARW